ncbi:ATP-binding protein [Ktedonosporobacter rubrisoli]|uniref:ATP-binding protein n=1 Tax=Ktedonosporobacter rubrisoli TaxID=2509675 RepID=A0A4P6JJJ2_KTERU|nr:ATP-binding protein [Ktedonosporobacter rubrisoli]QBD75285.1 ATP-binding protein [Ktedonosporobacter rubrisoli]
MKVAFVGKGGSGKTTLSALFCRYLALQKYPVLAFDADINQHLATALGLSEPAASAIPPLGLEMERIKAYVRGSNSRISSAAAMIKTTPPGRGSRLLHVTEANPIYEHFARDIHGTRLMVTGPFSQDDLGLKCYHSKVGAVELLLNHLLDKPEEYVVVDMTAGADAFASGLFTRFDITFIVVEPTLKSLGVYQQYINYAREYKLRIKVVGNKIETEDDVAFLHTHAGPDLLTWMPHSRYVRSQEKGRHLPLTELEEQGLATLATLKQAVDASPKDWQRFYQYAIEFHRKNALGWANVVAGEDLTTQIDHDYMPYAQEVELASSSQVTAL